ncbi:hypothetical protein I6A60_29315 [Frankia sp. AgB1.9]|nr:hypothetical protein [Frankia sp. AgW1.1]MBL7551929.1 hypothetical protein [Frankia sp. AgB1.9]MBL7623232.1 hypothetical protein [Frankia sp. AgB1.8]
MVLVVLSVTVFLTVSASRDGRRQVLLVTRDVPAGQVLTAADVRGVSVAVGPGVDVVEAGAQGSVVGRPAAVALSAGTLLAGSDLGAGRIPPAGQALVGIAVKAGSYPPGLRAGDQISILTTDTTTTLGTSGSDASGAEAGGAPVGARVGGLVVGVDAGDQGSSDVVVAVQVADADADDVARAAAGGRVVLVARSVAR